MFPLSRQRLFGALLFAWLELKGLTLDLFDDVFLRTLRLKRRRAPSSVDHSFRQRRGPGHRFYRLGRLHRLRRTRVSRGVLSPVVLVNSYCEVVGRSSRLLRAIIPPYSVVAENSVIGYDLDADRAKGSTVSQSGVVAVSPSPSSAQFVD